MAFSVVSWMLKAQCNLNLHADPKCLSYPQAKKNIRVHIDNIKLNQFAKCLAMFLKQNLATLEWQRGT